MIAARLQTAFSNLGPHGPNHTNSAFGTIAAFGVSTSKAVVFDVKPIPLGLEAKRPATTDIADASMPRQAARGHQLHFAAIPSGGNICHIRHLCCSRSGSRALISRDNAHAAFLLARESTRPIRIKLTKWAIRDAASAGDGQSQHGACAVHF
jgi:hypothetical protein